MLITFNDRLLRKLDLAGLPYFPGFSSFFFLKTFFSSVFLTVILQSMSAVLISIPVSGNVNGTRKSIRIDLFLSL